jgi:CheY-like chemotaxis protein
MSETDRRYVVVAFSPQPSLAYFLKGVLDCAGMTVVASSSTLDDLETVTERVRPDAIVYDVSYPFAENWSTLQRAREHPALRDVPVIVTTSEAQELFRRVGYAGAIELFARPKDLAAFQTAVRAAIRTTAPGCAA